jgi:hypothetical protein
VRLAKAGVWNGLMDAISAALDGDIQMIVARSVALTAGRDGNIRVQIN